MQPSLAHHDAEGGAAPSDDMGAESAAAGAAFVVHKHAARQLH